LRVTLAIWAVMPHRENGKLLFCFVQFLVEHVDAESVADTLQIGHVVGYLFDGIDLFLKILTFEEITEIGILLFGGDVVDVKKTLKRIEDF
jgi:hypothetical protein